VENVNVAPHAEEVRQLSGSDQPWRDLSEERVAHLSHTIAPLLRFSIAGSYAELQFENQTEQLALAHLRADAAEIERRRERITENLALLPTSIPEIRPHLDALAALQADAFWQHLSYARIMQMQETFAPLMRFRNRRPEGTFVRLSMPDEIARRHWIIFGPSGEGAFAETYRAQVAAIVKDLADDHPALQRLQRGETLSDDDLASIAAVLSGPDLFVTEEKLREAFQQPAATLADFLRDILDIAKLPAVRNPSPTPLTNGCASILS
jgi:type I restriction enzyme R subunit